MGISSKKSRTTTNQNQTATTTPVNPAYVDQGIEGLAGKIGSTFNNLDPFSTVPDANPLQTQAGEGAAGLTTSPNFGQASDVLSGLTKAGPQNISDYLAQFQNPYTNDVVNTTLADYDQNSGRTRAQQQLDLAGDTTFGGSGGSILRSLTEGELARGRANAEAQLRDQGFQTALGAATSQAGLNEQALSRQGAAAGGLADVGATQGDQARSNIATQAGIGDMLRQIAAGKANAPIDVLLKQIAAFSGLPLDNVKGATTTGSLSGTSTTKQSGASLGDWLDFLKANAAAAAGGGA